MGILNITSGEGFSPLVKPPITREQLNRYAHASGDHNPIHLDEAAARRVGLDSVIAHGMLSMAFLGQFIMQQIADIPDALLIQLKVRYVHMVRLGDTLTCHGAVKSRENDANGRESITIDCWVQNQKGEKVTFGEAVVSVPAAQKQKHEVHA